MYIESILQQWPDIIITGKLLENSQGEFFEARPAANPQGPAEIVKVIRIPLEENEGLEAAQLIAGAVQSQQSLAGENICQVRDVRIVQDPGEAGYFVAVRMEYVIPFSFYQAGRVLTENEITKIGADTAAAVECAAAAGITHGDIRPDNIFMDMKGSFKLDGFGVWPVIQERIPAKINQSMMWYLAPEVFQGAPKSESTDVYALGLVLYTFANGGNLPFNPDMSNVVQVGESLTTRVNGAPLPQLTGVSERLAGLIACAAACGPQDRFARAGALKNALRACSQPVPPVAPVPQPAPDAAPAQQTYQAPQVAPVPQPAPDAAPVQQPYEAPTAMTDPPRKQPKENGGKKSAVLPIIIIIAGVVVAALVALGIIFGPKLITKIKTLTAKEKVEESVTTGEAETEVINVQESTKEAATEAATNSSGSLILGPKNEETLPPFTEPAVDVVNLPYLINGKQATSADHAVKVGDIITLGRYEQDNNTGNGQEPIQWYVLQTDGAVATLLSVYGLDCQLFDKGTSGITWENSGIRSWLNNEFKNTAFTEEEITQILMANVDAPANSVNPSADAGYPTQDKVYLLSIDEALNLISSDAVRKVEPTAYAKARGVKYITDYAHVGDPEGYYWWLRTPGGKSNETNRYDRIALVAGNGTVDYKGTEYNDNETAVRPALQLYLDELAF